jgi:chromosome segregation ATPase
MPKAPDQTTDSAEAVADESRGAIAGLAAAFQALQARHDDLLHRFLTLIEERRALDQALFAERFKTAGLQRDLGVFQHEWRTAQAELTEVRAQNDHHKQLVQELRQLNETLKQDLHAIRHSRTWQLSQKYWALTRRVKGG